MTRGRPARDPGHGRAARRAARPRWLVALLPLVPGLAGCGGGSDASSTSAHETLHVLASSSLAGVFDALAQEFEAAHPGVEVTRIYDPSATVIKQLRDGAPADVIAAADPDTMQRVVEVGAVRTPAVFATNRLVIVTPRNNPATINSVDDLSRKGITWA